MGQTGEAAASRGNGLGRRAVVKGATGAAIGAVVWSEPTIRGLARRPAYAVGASGASSLFSWQFQVDNGGVPHDLLAGPLVVAGSIPGTFLTASLVGGSPTESLRIDVTTQDTPPTGTWTLAGSLIVQSGFPTGATSGPDPVTTTMTWPVDPLTRNLLQLGYTCT